MAGEYYRWLARNEKPEEKRELTPKEKRKNWWHYNKWYVLLGILAATGLIVKHASVFRDYEIVKGGMDDVFIAVTGKKLGGEQG